MIFDMKTTLVGGPADGLEINIRPDDTIDVEYKGETIPYRKVDDGRTYQFIPPVAPQSA